MGNSTYELPAAGVSSQFQKPESACYIKLRDNRLKEYLFRREISARFNPILG